MKINKTIPLKQTLAAIAFVLSVFALKSQQASINVKGLKIETINLREKYTMKAAGTPDSAHCNYDVTFQIFKGKGKTKKLAAGLNQLMNSAVTTDTAHLELPLQKRVEQDALEFKDEWAKLNSDPNAGWTFNYTKEQKFEAMYANRNFVSVKDQAYYFTGGAHGFRVTVYSLVDTKNGQVVEDWRMLFTDTTAVLKLAETAFRKTKNIPEGEALNKSWFWNGQFYLPDNFAYTEKGILFFYNVYEIAPYEQGETELLLDYDSLGKLLIKPDRK
jgi:hypothetical protein